MGKNTLKNILIDKGKKGKTLKHTATRGTNHTNQCG